MPAMVGMQGLALPIGVACCAFSGAVALVEATALGGARLLNGIKNDDTSWKKTAVKIAACVCGVIAAVAAIASTIGMGLGGFMLGAYYFGNVMSPIIAGIGFIAITGIQLACHCGAFAWAFSHFKCSKTSDIVRIDP